MRSARVLYHMVRADFLERVRRYSFLLTLAFALYLGYAAFTGHLILKLGDYGGVNNSAWLGAMMSLVSSTFLSLVGFYIVRNSVMRDEQTRVGRVLAATPMSKTFYVTAKVLSNFVVLLTMVGVLVLCALAMQIVKGDENIHPWAMLSPFIVFVAPVMLLTAAMAIFFETTPLLRTGAGNVLYFFLWSFMIASDIGRWVPSMLGLTHFMRAMGGVIRRFDPAYKDSFGLNIGGTKPAKAFVWNGLDLNAAILTGRLFWIAVAVVFAALAIVFFHRFDPAKQKNGRSATKETSESNGMVEKIPNIHLTPIMGGPVRSRFATLVMTEIKMLLKGQRLWWYAVAVGLAVAGAFTPSESRQPVLLAAMIWPVLLWSQMGTRESLFNTGGLMFCCPDPLWRQIPASWLAGVIVTAALTGTFALRMVVARDLAGFVSWAVSILFVPSMALALGTLSGNKKAFEAIYTVWWYIGPAHQVHGLDFLGLVPQSRTPTQFGLFTLALLITAGFARRQKLAYA